MMLKRLFMGIFAGLILMVPSHVQATELIAAQIYADGCSKCKIMEPAVSEVKLKYEQAGVQFVVFDRTSEETMRKSAALAKSLGIEKVFESQTQTGEMILIDAASKQPVGKLTKSHSAETMSDAIEIVMGGENLWKEESSSAPKVQVVQSSPTKKIEEKVKAAKAEATTIKPATQMAETKIQAAPSSEMKKAEANEKTKAMKTAAKETSEEFKSTTDKATAKAKADAKTEIKQAQAPVDAKQKEASQTAKSMKDSTKADEMAEVIPDTKLQSHVGEGTEQAKEEVKSKGKFNFN